jgi:hypothetical protein
MCGSLTQAWTIDDGCTDAAMHIQVPQKKNAVQNSIAGGGLTPYMPVLVESGSVRLWFGTSSDVGWWVVQNGEMAG